MTNTAIIINLLLIIGRAFADGSLRGCRKYRARPWSFPASFRGYWRWLRHQYWAIVPSQMQALDFLRAISVLLEQQFRYQRNTRERL